MASSREKKWRNSKTPRGVVMYLLTVARDTVDSCMFRSSATSRSMSGRSATSPYSKNICWRFTIASATRWMVV
ncbi:hypothetical protein D3C72_2532720 [compost metagenome]